MQEEWRPVPGCERILVSNTGKAKNAHTDQRVGYISHQYYYLTVSRGHQRLHRVIADVFIPNPHGYPVVDHIDGNKLNNDVRNLRWVTHSENTQNMHHHNPKVRHRNQVCQVDDDGRVVQEWPSVAHVTTAFDQSRNTLYASIGRRKKLEGYYWRYKDRERTASQPTPIGDDVVPITKRMCGCDFSNYSINRRDFSIINNRTKKKIKDFDHHGYRCVYLYANGNGQWKRRLLQHKLVHALFNGGEYEDIVDHKNMDKRDNAVANLEKVTQKENTVRATGKKVMQLDMNDNVVAVYDCMSDAYRALGRRHGCEIASTCNGIRYNKTKKKGYTHKYTYYGYKWRWV